MKTKATSCERFAVICLALWIVLPTRGGVVQWTGDGELDIHYQGYWWVHPENWDPGVPLAGDTVYLTDNKVTDTTVLFGQGNPWINQFYLGQSGGGTMRVIATNPIFPSSPFTTLTTNVGKNGKGEFDNDWISHETHTLIVGDAAGENGTYHCHDNGWEPVGNLDVGVLLMIGNGGTGKLELSEGGTAWVGTTSSNSAAIIGYQNGSSGTLIVRNPGSHFDTSTAVIVGFSGSASGAISASNAGVIDIGQACTVYNGTLDVTGALTAFSAGGDLTIGRGAGNGGVMTVTDHGAASSDGACIIGGVQDYSSEGRGKLEILLGGDLETASGVIGQSSVQSSGTYSVATVDGTGSSWTTTGDLSIGATLHDPDDPVNPGVAGRGVLYVQNSGLVSSQNGIVGDGIQSVGWAYVSSANSAWLNSGTLTVGGNGTGYLTIEEGATVTSADGSVGNTESGLVNVFDSNSVWSVTGTLAVGDTDTGGDGDKGLLIVSLAGNVVCNEGVIGRQAGSEGSATVSGTDSTWTTYTTLTVGGLGKGSLSIQSGGEVISHHANVGTASGGDGGATVTGTDSTWNSSGDLTIGPYGAGLLVSAGGQVSAANVHIASGAAASTAYAKVYDAGSHLHTDDLNVAGTGTGASPGPGVLSLDGGGTVEADGCLRVYGKGTVNLESGSDITGDLVDIAFGGLWQHLGGTLSAQGTNASFSNNGTVDGMSPATPMVFGKEWTVSGTGLFVNSVVQGTFAPGNSPAVVNTENLSLQGTVEIELGGLAPGQHDQINDADTLVLGADSLLEIRPWSAFVPAVGDHFVVMTWETELVGTFAHLAVDPWFAGQGLNFEVSYTNVSSKGELTLVVTATTPYEDWAAASGLTLGMNDGFDEDPNADGRPNIEHFAYDTDPLGGGMSEGKRRIGIDFVDGTDYFTLTLPVRAGAAFAGSPHPSAVVDGILYAISGDDDLVLPPVSIGVLEFSPPLDAGLPALRDLDGDGKAEWEYRSFRLAEDVASLSPGFMIVDVKPAP